MGTGVIITLERFRGVVAKSSGILSIARGRLFPGVISTRLPTLLTRRARENTIPGTRVYVPRCSYIYIYIYVPRAAR